MKIRRAKYSGICVGNNVNIHISGCSDQWNVDGAKGATKLRRLAEQKTSRVPIGTEAVLLASCFPATAIMAQRSRGFRPALDLLLHLRSARAGEFRVRPDRRGLGTSREHTRRCFVNWFPNCQFAIRDQRLRCSPTTCNPRT